MTQAKTPHHSSSFRFRDNYWLRANRVAQVAINEEGRQAINTEVNSGQRVISDAVDLPEELFEIVIPIWLPDTPASTKERVIRRITGLSVEEVECGPGFYSEPIFRQIGGKKVEVQTLILTMDDSRLPTSCLQAPAMVQWASSGYYLQAGFCAPSKVPGSELFMELFDFLSIMNRHDFAYCQNGEVGTELPVRIATDAEVVRFEMPLWNGFLLKERNRLLITYSAMLMGRDPVADYWTFLTRGGKYFLEYPGICK